MLKALMTDPILQPLPVNVTVEYVDDLIKIETGQARATDVYADN